ncbi:hypothetical protein RJT34_13128 [Clitoria ternatea]|uniref:Uncharacterized protein n=1 Tax=Clitoria ternatea TaxID=43366 RepID=A0AAN9JNF9_CLITE
MDLKGVQKLSIFLLPVHSTCDMAPYEMSLKDLRMHYEKAVSSKRALSTTALGGASTREVSLSAKSSLIPTGVPISTAIPISVVSSGSYPEKEAGRQTKKATHTKRVNGA